jgi:hypothetical protein
VRGEKAGGFGHARIRRQGGASGLIFGTEPSALLQIGIISQQGDNGSLPSGRKLARNFSACAVKAGARGTNIGITTVGPIDEVRHRLQQGLP